MKNFISSLVAEIQCTELGKQKTYFEFLKKLNEITICLMQAAVEDGSR